MQENYIGRFEASKTFGNIGFSYSGKVITDRETGVQYLFVGGGYGGGLTPIIDKDGKPILANTAKARL